MKTFFKSSFSEPDVIFPWAAITLVVLQSLKMEPIRFNNSMKNIPISSKNAYLKRLIEKVENVIKRMRWKAFFFERNEDEDQDELAE